MTTVPPQARPDVPQQSDDFPEEQSSFDRMPPQDLDAERAVAGGVLLASTVTFDVMGEVVGVLGAPRAGIFYWPAHELVYRAAYDLWTDGQPIDFITVTKELTKRGEITRVGGPAAVSALCQAVPTAANASYYAETVLEKAKRRKVVEVCTKAVQDGYTGIGDTDALIDSVLSEVQNLVLDGTETEKLSVADRWAEFVDEQEAGEDPNAIDSPWRDLNDVVNVKPGEVIVIGAATSGGKSLMAFNWGAHVALKLDKPVLAFSMEMGAKEVMCRLAAAEGTIPLTNLMNRTMTDSDWEKFSKVSDRMMNAHNFIIDDNGSTTLGAIRARARWMASTGQPPGLIIVDYLQLMETEGKGQNRTQEVADVSRGLKKIAMDFKVPVIALAQFNREAKDRRPTVTDFKESSSIEQDASVILLLHVERDDEGNPVKPGEVDVIVAKNRNGMRDRIFPLAMQSHYGRLANLAHA